MKFLLTLLLFSYTIGGSALPLQGQRDGKNSEDPQGKFNPLTSITKSPLHFNFRTKTLGGKQFWTDLRIQDGWRIQQNIFTEHYRLLDPKDIRHEWGTLKECEATFNRFTKAGHIRPYKKRVIILLHGIIRTRSSMDSMDKYLRGRIAGSVLNMDYASTRDTLEHHAEALHRILANIPTECDISFVCHSMGNLVVRRFFHRWQDPRITRVVMLAPPNQGSALGTMFHDYQLFEQIWGISGQEITAGFGALKTKLAVPPCEFGIIAGVYSSKILQNHMLEGENDLVVTVEETKLSGARDFRSVNATHTRIMANTEVQRLTYLFLQRGYFETATTRTPLK
ncbi:MAG: alpha/beta hydrolase [Planctomycetaceae bacterium]|jgi:hypothetical protein|nr:alpha/beta hydrolase [Planctomycetaceae bacterium]